jgi:hypothetical protein
LDRSRQYRLLTARSLSEWKHENQIELGANPNFFRGKPAMERVTMFMVNEKTTALAMYERGQLDFIDNHSIPIFEKSKLANKRGFKRVPQLRGYYYGFVTDRKPFNDPRVRKAFMMAVDRTVFPSILHGGEIPAPSWIPPGMLAHNTKIGLPFNAPEARRLLREAGYPEGKGFPPVVLAYNTEEDHKMVAEAVQGMWQRNLGVVVKIENQEWKVYLKKLQNDPPNIFRLGWGADYPDPDNFMKLFTANSGNNNTRWKNPRYDQLLEQAARELDTAKRAALRLGAKTFCEDRPCRSCRCSGRRKYAAQSPFHRTGAKLHGAHGPAPRPARETVKNLGKVQNVQAVQMVQIVFRIARRLERLEQADWYFSNGDWLIFRLRKSCLSVSGLQI